MLRIGTVGTSPITGKLIEASKEVDDVEVVAVCSRTEKSAHAFAKKFYVERAFTDLNQMATDSEVDAVYVATPNTMHFEHVMSCLAAGKHVLCEKPLFMTGEELEQAYQEADRQGVVLLEAMRHIHAPNFKNLMESVSKVGNISSVYLHRIRYSSKYDRYLAGEINSVFSKELGGGATRDLGVYPLATCAALFGEPNSVQFTPTRLENGVDGAATIVLKYNRFHCTVMCSKISTSYNKSEIHGDQGTLMMDNVAPITSLSFTSTSGESIDVGVEDLLPNMSYELITFRDLVNRSDLRSDSYNYYRSVSRILVKILEQCES
ncbi:Gfo/Idh/MocA family protein [Halalkalibacillus halophilus]|uniref:Gfo/Idh/MocA family protein n=1 Tax=Halalkalibacillus halophilus TaxID=392827 RepID=UPI00040A1EC6|nr:Gfo/Idh/MocA family oxidoreductase [Halalkalibacillus halophilus]